jgi:ligand-binding sensor domain-containing protein
MRSSILKIAASIALVIVSLNQTSAQLAITNYSNKDHVYAINITKDTVWIGTDGGIVQASIYGTVMGTITVNDSLSSNFITAIAVDSSDFKWFGTYDRGLIRYKGNSIQYLNATYNPMLGSRINCIEVDDVGRVWIGTDMGVARYNGTTFDLFTTNSNIQGPVTSICIDGTNVWFGTASNGLYRYNGTWQKIPAANGLTATKINGIAQKTDTVFVATETGLFYHLKSGSNFFLYPGLGINCMSVAINPINGTPWVGGQSIIYRLFNMGTLGFTQFVMAYYPILKFARNGDVWAGFGKQGKGVKYSNGTVAYNLGNSEISPPTNEITSVLQHNYITYFGTKDNGIISFDNVQWTSFFTTNPKVLSLAAKGDSIFAGTQDEFYILYSGSENPYPTTSPINTICVDKENVVWFGTDNGIFTFKENLPTNVDATGLYNPKVIKIAVDKLNTKWFLHSGGLTRYDGISYFHFNVANMGIAGAELFDIAVDTLDNLWIASSAGVLQYNGSNFQNYTQTNGLSENKILSVFVDNKNIKYFGTANSGLSLFNGTGFKNIGRSNYRLAASKITSINGERFSNNIWVAGEYGGISQLYINPLVVYIMPEGITPLCSGNAIKLNSSVSEYGLFPDQLKFSWSASDGSITSSQNSIVVNPKAPTTYYLTSGDGILQTVNQYFVDVVQITPATISGPRIVCSNSTNVQYSIPFDASRTFIWGINGGTIPNNISTNIDAFWDFSAKDAYLTLSEYDMNSGCSISQQYPIVIEIVPIPNLVRKGENLIICKDSGMMVYHWYLDGSLLTAPNRQFLNIPKVTAGASGSYSVGITTHNGCFTASNALEVVFNKVSFYPNPAKNLVNIEYYNLKPFSGSLKISDTNGSLVQKIEVNSLEGAQKTTFDVSDYKPGAYFYQLFDEESIYSSGKFIKE